MGVTSDVAAWLSERLKRAPSIDSVDEMNLILRALAKWRARVLINTQVKVHGAVVTQGPFVGMHYVNSTEGALLPRLLGTYECELHPHLAAIIATGIDCVIDVGCAEGYYAVGLARTLPNATVYAFDTNPLAQSQCALMAAHNGVADRVVIGGELQPEGFEDFAGRRALVLVDTEGAEDEILRPDLSPSLARMNIIVETHEGFRSGVGERLIERFEPSHRITRVDSGPKTMPLPQWLMNLGHLDQLLAVWEWRSFPTPWLVMTPK